MTQELLLNIYHVDFLKGTFIRSIYYSTIVCKFIFRKRYISFNETNKLNLKILTISCGEICLCEDGENNIRLDILSF